MRPRRITWPTLLVVGVTAFAPLSAGAAAAVEAPLDPYPVSAPSPLGNSIPPDYLDEDETVRARIDPSGRVRSLVDDTLIKIRGAGDYVVQLPARVTQVANLGGDSVPGLQDGHVSFLGHAIGAQQLAVEATLDLAQASTLPVSLQVRYSTGGREVTASDIPRTHTPITVTMVMTNLTGQPHQFLRGSAPAAPLAQVLEALRRAPDIYIPEVFLGDQLPVPTTLPVSQPATVDSRQTFVPLTMTTTVRLPAGVTASATSPAADVTVDARGTRLLWVHHLPSGTDALGVDTLSFTFAGAHPRLPAIDIKADPLPLPAALFTPPGGGTWAAYLGGRADRTTETVLAQLGMASIHRIGELAQPLGRPGPGPVKVKYDFILDSAAAPAERVPGPPPVRGQPLLIAVTLALGALAALFAARAWARH